MNYLLDTSIASTVLAKHPDAALVAWISAHELECAVSAVTFGEMARGVERLPEGKQRAKAARALKMFWEDFSDRILPLSDVVAAHWARYHTRASKRGTPPPLMDSWIAATAEFYSLKVVTRNAKDFPLLDVEVI